MGGLAIAGRGRLRQAADRPRGQLPRPVVAPAPAAAAGRAAARPAAADAVVVEAATRRLMPAIVKERWRTHWNRERLTLVALGIVCFYVVYVSYRNLKSFLPVRAQDTSTTASCTCSTGRCSSATTRRTVLHALLGTPRVAWPLSYVYLWFLPLVPLARHRLAGVVAQPVLRLLVRDLAVHRLDARHGVLLRAADPRPGPGVRLALRRPRRHPDHRADGLPGQRATACCSGPASSDAVQSVAGLRQPAHRDHPAGGADGAVHAPARRSSSGSSGSTSASPSSPPSTSAGTTSPTTSPA